MGQLRAVELKTFTEKTRETIAKVLDRINDGEIIEKILIVTASSVPDDKAVHFYRTVSSCDMTCADELWLLENAKWKLLNEVRG